jgi:hypothetical protein
MQKASTEKRKSAFSLQPSAFVAGVLLCLLAFGLRIYQLNAQSLWYDETFTAYHAQQGLAAGVAGLLQEDNTLPLYGALLALWIKLAGSGEFALRYFSVLIGTIAAPLALRLGRALTGRQIGGWGAALAIATLPIQVYYAQEVRMYALTVPLAVAFAWAGWRLARRGRGAIAYVALGVAMLLAHLYTGLLWAAVLLWSILLWLAERPRFHARPWLWANLSLGILALPIAAWGLWRAQVDATATSAIPLDVLKWLPVQFGVGQYLPAMWSILFECIAAFSIIAAIVELIRTHRSDAALWIGFALVVPVALLLAISHIKAKWDARYLLPSLGLAVAVGAGLGWEMLARRRAWLGLVVALAWVGLALPAVARQAQGTWALGIIDEWHPRPDFRGVAEYITAHDEPGDAIVVVGGYAAHTLAFYYDGPAHLFGLPQDTRLADFSHPLDLGALDDLEQETGDARRVWLVLWQAHLADPTNLVQSTLVEQCHRLPVPEHFTNVGLLLFDVTSCRPLNRFTQPPYPLEAAFAAPIRLTGYDLRQAGETWELDLWWEATGPIGSDYAVFTHLVGADGTLVAQHDHIAGSDLYPTEKWAPGTRLRDRFFLQVPDGKCTNCVIQVGLYNDAGRLPLSTGQDMVAIPLP